MKRTPLKRKSQLRARMPLRGAKRPLGASKRVKRTKLPKLSTMRNKCDNLLTPIIKARHPNCLLCGNLTEVAHHHVHKSKSNRLRYELDNLINLCGRCHVRLHANESYWASKVVEIKGIEWFQRIEKMNHELVKVDVHWYIEHYERLNLMI